MKGITLGKSPITNTVYAGKLNKDKTMWLGEKQDVTNNFLQVMSDLIPKNGAISVGEEGDTIFIFSQFPKTKEGIEKAIAFYTKRLSEISNPFS